MTWARQDLNLQPTDYESAALTRLSYEPETSHGTDARHPPLDVTRVEEAS